MSITLGASHRLGALTILVGGTGSASLADARRLFTAAEWPASQVDEQVWGGTVWPGHAGDRPARIAEWKGGFPFKIFGLPLFDPRRAGVQEVLDLVGDGWREGFRRIAVVGFSHGGTIAIRAMASLLDIPLYRGVEFRLVTLATPPLRDTRGFAHAIDTARCDWLGVVDRADSVATGFAGIIENLDGRMGKDFGVETAFRELATPRSGVAAHDQLPGSPECREAVRNHYGRRKGEQG